jgi:hypothetical protein
MGEQANAALRLVDGGDAARAERVHHRRIGSLDIPDDDTRHDSSSSGRRCGLCRARANRFCGRAISFC